MQKAGTTAVHDFLAQHPHIALLRDQALHFFDKEEHFTGEPDYRILLGNFDPGWRWRVAGEVTADYLYYHRALERIARYNPKMKLIVSLRNPVERAFSQWNMRRDKGQEPLEFLDALKRDQEIGIWKGPRGSAYLAAAFTPRNSSRFSNSSRAIRCSLLSTRTSAPILSPCSIGCSTSLACSENRV